MQDMTRHGCMCKHCGEFFPERQCTGQLCGECAQKHGIAGNLARSVVSNAVRRGKLPPAREFSCMDCGDPAQQYDHRDYARPLNIDPVCRGCNTRRGVAMLGPHG